MSIEHLFNRFEASVAGIVTLLVVLVWTTGCMPIWQGNELQEDLEAMEARQAELETEAEERERELAEMIEDAQREIDNLESVLDEARQLLRRDSAELEADVRESRDDVRQLRGKIEELEFQHRRLEQTLEAFRRDMDRQFVEVEPDELLEKSEEFRDNGEYDLARWALEQFLEDHDDHELASEARLELGEIYVTIGMWEHAIDTLDPVRDDPASTARQARATYLIGEALFHTGGSGDCGRAEIAFEIVAEDFPHSDDVDAARQRLEEIEQGECPP